MHCYLDSLVKFGIAAYLINLLKCPLIADLKEFRDGEVRIVFGRELQF